MRTLILAALAAHLTLPPIQKPDELSQLNDCIQQRLVGSTTFGMRRILPNGGSHGIRQFRAENFAEQAAINQLERKGYEVALYLAGRNVMAAPSRARMVAMYRYGVQGPAYITRIHDAGELPGQDALLEESRGALANFGTGQGYEIQRGDWTVALRPLRATNQTCVQCHNASGANVKMNDVLGVAMYVYRHN
jgi:hypothetical protein